MKCLVLGGGGFIGSNLCKRLIKEGHEVIVFDRNILTNINIAPLLNKMEFVEEDFTSDYDFKSILNGVDIVFHLISTTLPSTSNLDYVFDISSNVLTTLKLLDDAVKVGVKKIIFVSSGGTVYGIPKSIPIPENHLTDPICSYGIQKLTIEKYLHLYYSQYGLDYTIIRLSNPYGEGQTGNNLQGVIPIFIKRILANQTIDIWGDGSIIRDYIYVEDAIEALVATVYYQGSEKLFNIGSGVGLSLLEVSEIISRVFDYSCKIRFLEGRKIDVPVNILDISRAVNQLKWKPKILIEEGIFRIKESILNGDVRRS